MFIKFFKYDFFSVLKKMLFVYVVAVGITIIFGVTALDTKLNYNAQSNEFYIEAAILYQCIFYILFFIGAIVILTRYFRNGFTTEGYLTHTLPISKHTIILSKFLLLVVLSFLSFVVALLCYIIFRIFIFDFSYFFDFISLEILNFSDLYSALYSIYSVLIYLWSFTLIITTISISYSSLNHQKLKFFSILAITYIIVVTLISTLSIFFESLSITYNSNTILSIYYGVLIVLQLATIGLGYFLSYLFTTKYFNI